MKKLSCQVVVKPPEKGKEMDKLYIVCKSKKEESKVLKKLEKQGKKWSTCAKPTEHSYFLNSHNEYAIIVYGSVICYTENVTMNMLRNENSKKISAAEFLKKNKETIVIYRNGSETIALEKNTGRKAVAKCSAEDTYSFEIGAKLALTRLFPETVREVKRYAEVGEYIKITDPIAAMGKYKRGDVFRVTEAFPETEYAVQHVKCYEVSIIIRYDEYVVLENYQPEEKPQEKREQYYTGKVVCVRGNIGYTVGRIYEIKDGILKDDDGDVRPKDKSNKIRKLEDYTAAKFIELVE